MGSNKKKKSKVEIKRLIFIFSFLITVFLLLTVFMMGSIMDKSRTDYIDDKYANMARDIYRLQSFFLLSEAYDNEMACLAFENKLKELDKTVWELGETIEKYRQASEEFQKDEYYLEKKKVFNENEVFYYLLMRKMMKQCNLSKHTILYFYSDSDSCKKCDDQSFILTDLKKDDEEAGKEEIAIFSFDMTLNISTLDLLKRYYDIEEYPCLVINEEPYCGIRGQEFIQDKICESDPDMNLC